MFPKRNGFKWSSNEINRLFHEYEIKELDILQIAEIHERTPFSVLVKLESEGIIEKEWDTVRGYHNNVILRDEIEPWDVSDISEESETSVISYVSEESETSVISSVSEESETSLVFYLPVPNHESYNQTTISRTTSTSTPASTTTRKSEKDNNDDIDIYDYEVYIILLEFIFNNVKKFVFSTFSYFFPKNDVNG